MYDLLKINRIPSDVLQNYYTLIRQELKARRKQEKKIKQTRSREFLSENSARHATFKKDSVDPLFMQVNSVNFMAFPNLNQKWIHRQQFLAPLLVQDWSLLFTDGDSDRKYCVYMHVRANGKHLLFPSALGGHTTEPFYIGKGTKERAHCLSRNRAHQSIYKEELGKLEDGEGVKLVHIVRDRLTEAEALELESKLVYFFQTMYESKDGILTNLDIPRRPEFSGNMKHIGDLYLESQE